MGALFELLADAKFDDVLASVESLAPAELTDQDRVNCYILTGDTQSALAMLERLHAEGYLSLPPILTDAILEP